MIITCCSTGIGWYCGCLSTSTSARAAVELRWVAASRSEPNCGERLELAVLRQVEPERPATCFIALICALPPTRDSR